ncbi:serine hydrolase domain-containing protein [Ruminiclostridium cellulolyticum]|uniref:Beta-lactamase n=1 Tax=Ruminiclostridium cellulolyticum (strain ATCC 35319 / DSM 5812 / JCM 6584 / H10) TaxID=394503 RepID=B8I975_RUMCH|nr:serine hydrolase domain-containing protein [Ruminiclostridium cellulolyticum]ACL75335.1 beta-lactamase [Ruminiclostridium cellulolyticum H10]
MKIWCKSAGLCLIITFILCMFLQSFSVVKADNTGFKLSNDKIGKIDELIQKQMDKSKIQGLSLVIVSGDKAVYKKCYGYAEIETKKPVTEDTLFELGSTSKAFTALGIYKLEDKGLINLDDSVSKYIPWLKLNYKGKSADLTLNHFLHHTSGVSFLTLEDIKPSTAENALEQTVRTLQEIELDTPPGKQFQYATINYDVLGLVIEKVTGKSFEDYMQDEVLLPCGLNNTFTTRNQAVESRMAAGYKVSLMRPVKYNAPVFLGNIPAGYFITNINDVQRWLSLHLGSIKLPSIDYKLMEKSHEIDTSVEPHDIGVLYDKGERYGAGWERAEGRNGFFHGGANPNYSSYMFIRPDQGMGIGMLCNFGSDTIQILGKNLVDIIDGNGEPSLYMDVAVIGDKNGTILTIILAIVDILIIISMITKIRRYRLKISKSPVKKPIGLIIASLLLIILGYMLYILPRVICGGFSWNFVLVCGGLGLPLGTLSIFLTGLLTYINYCIKLFYPGKRIHTSYIQK